MALIVCKGCGKKISDTVEKCIHCGAPTLEPAPVPEEKKPSHTDEKPEKLIKYYSLDQQTRLDLEKAFLATDKRAEKFRRAGIEIEKYKNLFGLGIGLIMLLALAIMLIIFKALDLQVYKADVVISAAGSALILIGILALCLLVVTIIGAVYKRSFKKYIYLKKYQQWLREEKNIKYNPLFANAKAAEKFKSVNLETMYL